ncbi:MAG: ABC transporter ATP-binding protein [Acidimicrobiia bacterium]
MSSDVAIAARGVGKAYTIRHQDEHHITLAESVLSRVRHPFQRQEKEQFWALKDVSFDVKQGEVLGIIGRNGAGKSTLLKILSRITAPTTGSVELYGRVGSLLEVGTGFHPELTGRENIYLNGAILGMRKSEINRQFDEIVDFAGVEKFLDTPVKRYSSGMYVRLAFAVAAHLRTEILIVDEVLAVGDAEFQKKCLGKMGEVAHDGRTVLLVSHNADTIRALSSVALLLHGGGLSAFGCPDSVLIAYAESSHSVIKNARRHDFGLTGDVRFLTTHTNATVGLGESIDVEVGTAVSVPESYAILFVFHDLDRRPLATAVIDQISPDSIQPLSIRIDTRSLAAGDYLIDIVACSACPESGYRDHDIIMDALHLQVDAPTGGYRPPPTWGRMRLEAQLQRPVSRSNVDHHWS